MTIKINTIEEALEFKAQKKLVGQFEMPDEVYFSPKLEAISQSGLKFFSQSPAHYKASLIEPEETPALLFGKMFHAALLEPDIFAERYVSGKELGKLDLRTNADNAKLFAFKEKHAGKTIIQENEFDQLTAMQKVFWSHPYMENIMKDALTEQAFFWNDPETGVLCKMKIDILNPRLVLVSDLKSTIDASEFYKTAANNGLHIQNAFYIDHLRMILDLQAVLIFIVVEKSLPYGIRLCKLSTDDIKNGRILYKEYLKKYADCFYSDSWPCYPYDIQTVELPAWANRIN